MSDKQYLDITEAHEYAGRHENTIRRWIHDGKLPAYRFGRELRVKREDLDAMYKPVEPVKTEA